MNVIEEVGTQVSETYRAIEAWGESLHAKVWKSVDGSIGCDYTDGAVEVVHCTDGSWTPVK